MIQIEKMLQLFDCKNADAWSAALFEIARQCGFQYALYGVMQSKKTPFETAFIRSNYSEQWRNIYDRKCFHYIDPVVAHCQASALPIAWSADSFRGNVQQDFYEQASGHGLRSGITYPIHGAEGEFGMLSFVSANRLHMRALCNYELLTSLSLVRDYALESSIRFARTLPNDLAQTRLTPRELECIKWVMAGKSSWEIARILCCSEATINFHIANLKRKFQVQTRQQAVVKAIKEGLIVPA